MDTGVLYLVRPHEANEENGRKSHSEDVDTPEPRTLVGGQQEALYDTGLEYTYTYCASPVTTVYKYTHNGKQQIVLKDRLKKKTVPG